MKNLTKINYKEMKKWLSRGEIRELAEKEGIGVGYAYHVLAGRKYNPAFIKAFIDLVTERKKGIMHSLNKYHNVRRTK